MNAANTLIAPLAWVLVVGIAALSPHAAYAAQAQPAAAAKPAAKPAPPPKPINANPLDSLRAKAETSTASSARALATIPVTEGTALGSGYATTLSSVRAQAVVNDNTEKFALVDNPDHVTELPGKLETGTTYSIHFVSDYEELVKSLEITASGSWSGGSARASLVQKSSMNKLNAYVLVRMTVLTRREDLPGNYALTAKAAERASSNDYFFGGYGDAFVTAVIYGGELCALLEYSASSLSESEAVRADAKQRAGAANFAGSIDQSMSKLTQNTRVNITYAQTGGFSGEPVGTPTSNTTGAGGKPAQVTAPDQMTAGGVLVSNPKALLERMNRFPLEVHKYPNRAKALFAEIKDYSTVNNWPKPVGYPTPGSGSRVLAALDTTTLYVRGEHATADGMLKLGAVAVDGDAELLKTRKDYASYMLSQLSARREDVAANPQAPHDTLLLSLPQYYAERRLGLDASVSRRNVMPQCDFAQGDMARVKDCMFGRGTKLLVDTWPSRLDRAATRLVRAYDGERPQIGIPPFTGPWIGVQIGCPPKAVDAAGERAFYQRWADTYCKVVPGGNVVAVIQGNGGSFAGNGCGYGAVSVACLAYEKPTMDVARLPKWVEKPMTPAQAKVTSAGAGGMLVETTVNTGCRASVGRYLVRATVKGAVARALRESAYWYQSPGEGEPVVITHLVTLAAGETLQDVHVSATDTYCLDTPAP